MGPEPRTGCPGDGLAASKCGPTGHIMARAERHQANAAFNRQTGAWKKIEKRLEALRRRIRDLLHERRQAYAAIPLQVDTTGRTPAEATVPGR